MLLSARPLINVSGVNDFEISDTVSFTQGDALYVYFQLIDQNKDRTIQGFKPSGRRYVPASGSTLSVVIPSVDSTRIITKTATNPYSSDTSIWRIQITASDALVGTYSLKLTLTEGATVTYGTVNNMLSVSPQNSSYC